jgi:hypothetical protein
VSEPPLDGARILDLLREVDAELPEDGSVRTVVLVGGALLALHGLRGATLDVDSATRMDDEMWTASSRVAARHGLSSRWLNDAALAWLPAGFRPGDCPVVLTSSRLQVRAAPLSVVFLMKLNALRAADREDLRRIWAQQPFSSVESAMEEYRAAYPDDRDEFLEVELRRVLEA